MLLSPYLHPKLRSLGTELYKSPHVNARCALAYIPSLVGMKGVTEQCTARLHLTLSQMSPGQSFEMTQEKPVSLILKLRRANNFVINVIVYSECNSEVEMLNNRKVICHEYALKKHAKSKRNLPTPLSKCVILK